MKIGIQMFGVLRDHKEDTLGALKALKEMGYSLIEPCVSLGRIEGFDHVIWPLDWFLAHADELKALGFEFPSCHIFGKNLTAQTEALGKLIETTGIRTFIVKLPRDGLTAERLHETAIDYMNLANALAPFGAEVLIHNETHDIAAKVNGKTAFEYVLDLCLGKVGAQVDIGWVFAGGEDPEALLWRNAQRVRSLHFKDLVREGDACREVPLGEGQVDNRACFQFARAFGCALVADLDSFQIDTSADELRASCAFLARLSGFRERTVSFLNTLDVDTGEVRVLKRFDRVIEAPNWLKTQNRILFNSEGRMYAYDLDSGEETLMDTGICTSCNNDHVVSPDEKALAVSHMSMDERGFSSRVYVVPMEGGAARLVTPNSPSFLHGWSPDGAEFAYCAFREIDGQREVDVYTIPVAGGEETRLTTGGFNDGPEYSPDGRYIWFNSTRSGLMQIWRMKRDGSEPTQMTTSERNNWFAHISPDGKRAVYLSYAKGELEPHEHLPNMRVELYLMNADGTDQRRICALFGGQGSMNVNSWAGDDRHIAFVSYELEHN